MAFTQDFTGGSSGSSPSYSDTRAVYEQDTVYWNGGNINLAGDRVAKVNSISPHNTSGWEFYALRTGDGTQQAQPGQLIYNWAAGSTTYIRLVKAATGGQLTFYKTTGTGGSVYEYLRSNDSLLYTWSNASLAGSYTWSTVATAPGSISAVRTGRNMAITATASADGGGAVITSYEVQYRTSTDNSTWGAWGNTQTLSGFAYTYTGLTPALYYQFRVYANNDVGSSAGTVSASQFLPAGGKRWTGSSWDSTTIARRWDGANWVDISTAKRWDGSSWVDLG